MSYIDKIQIHKENRLAGLYPTAKLWVVILYSASSFVLGSIGITQYQLPLLLIPWFFVVPALCAASGVMKKGLGALKAVFFVAAFIFVVQTFIVPGGEELARFGFLRVCENGLRTGISLSFMILDVAGIFVWFFQTTEHREISCALDNSGLDYKVGYVFSSTLSMIDVLGESSKTIMNAQRARGVETEGNMIVRAKAFFPTLVPLILGSVIGSEERVLTLEARGFSLEGPRTHLVKLEHSKLEKPVIAVFAVACALIVAWRVALWVL